jgi:SH3-like domain-containing protein
MIMGEFGMKKCLAVLASLSMLVTAGAPAFAAKRLDTKTTERTSIFASPSYKARVITMIPGGQKVRILDKCKGDFCPIKWKDTKGYVDECDLDATYDEIWCDW